MTSTLSYTILHGFTGSGRHMDNTAFLLCGLLFSSAGLGYLIYGRRQQHRVAFYTGIVLMCYPYFVDSMAQLILVGVLLLLAPRFLKI